MKKLRILIPGLMAFSGLPLVSVVGCNNNTKPLCFTDVLNDNQQAQISYSIQVDTLDVDIEYKLNDGEWLDWEEGNVITLENGQNLYVRNTKNTLSKANNYFKFVTTGGDVESSGNVNSMINYQKLTPFCFNYLFSDCKTLKKAPVLPATELAKSCYANMFNACTSLIQAPQLPAKTLTESCYLGMFSGCTALEQAPELNSTSLAPHCYEQMFDICGLTSAPKLPAEQLADSCYAYMFRECHNITQMPTLASTKLAKNCYFYMFANCNNLIQVQESLPATQLKESCYDHMFYKCTSLTSAPEIKGQKYAQKCFEKMFADCQNLSVREDANQESLICKIASNIEDTSNIAFEMFRGCIRQPETFGETPKVGHSYYCVKQPAVQSYLVHTVESSVDWSIIPQAPVNIFKWTDGGPQYQTFAQMILFKHTVDDVGLMVRLVSYEADPLKNQHTPGQDDVYKNSCLDAYFKFATEDKYYNIEIDSDNNTCQEFGLAWSKGQGRTNIKRGEWYFVTDTHDKDNYWETIILMNLEAICYWYNKDQEQILSVDDFKSGFSFTGNFFSACSTQGPKEHYGMWNEMTNKEHTFHDPSQFGTFTIVD